MKYQFYKGLSEMGLYDVHSEILYVDEPKSSILNSIFQMDFLGIRLDDNELIRLKSLKNFSDASNMYAEQLYFTHKIIPKIYFKRTEGTSCLKDNFVEGMSRWYNQIAHLYIINLTDSDEFENIYNQVTLCIEELKSRKKGDEFDIARRELRRNIKILEVRVRIVQMEFYADSVVEDQIQKDIVHENELHLTKIKRDQILKILFEKYKKEYDDIENQYSEALKIYNYKKLDLSKNDKIDFLAKIIVDFYYHENKKSSVLNKNIDINFSNLSVDILETRFLKVKIQKVKEAYIKLTSLSEETSVQSKYYKEDKLKKFFLDDSEILSAMFSVFHKEGIISDDLSKENFENLLKNIENPGKSDHIYLHCETTLFAFIIDRLKNSKIKEYTKPMVGANLERLLIFKSNNGIFINGNLLSASRTATKNQNRDKHYRSAEYIVNSIVEIFETLQKNS